MALIADGVVDRGGVPGLASRVGYSVRQLHRILTAELGAGPLAIALDARARNARTLIRLADLGVQRDRVRRRVRQHPAVQRRGARDVRAHRPSCAGSGFHARRSAQAVTLPAREPYDSRQVFDFLAARASARVESVEQDRYVRTMRLPYGPGLVDVRPSSRPGVTAALRTDLRDLAPAVNRIRRLFDLDADPVAVTDALGADRVLAPSSQHVPACACPGRSIRTRRLYGRSSASRSRSPRRGPSPDGSSRLSAPSSTAWARSRARRAGRSVPLPRRGAHGRGRRVPYARLPTRDAAAAERRGRRRRGDAGPRRRPRRATP